MLARFAAMKRHNSKVVKTLKISTSDTNPKKKLKAIVRTMLTSSSVGKLITQRRALGAANTDATLAGAATDGLSFPVRGNHTPNCRRLETSKASPIAIVNVVPNHAPTTGGTEPARAI